mgnify:CR=1 FL=1
MNTIIIQVKEGNSSLRVFDLLKKNNIKSKVLSSEQLEDSVLAHLIDKGMEEDGEVPIEELRKKLRK